MVTAAKQNRKQKNLQAAIPLLIRWITTKETLKRSTEVAVSVAYDYFEKACCSPKYQTILSEIHQGIFPLFSRIRSEMGNALT